MASISSTAPGVSRYRLVQTVTSNEITHDFQAAKIPTSPEWNPLVVVPVVASFVAWFSLESYKRRSHSRLLSDSNCICDTVNFQNEKGGANLPSGKGSSSLKVPGHSQSAKRSKSLRRWIIQMTAMLLFMWPVVWLCYLLVSPSSALLEVFQVYHPLSAKALNESLCNESVLLMNHVFGFSYAHPFVGELFDSNGVYRDADIDFLGFYKPPSCNFDTVRVNLTVTSRGRQFDRLGHMYLGDVEIFRSSTAEPTTNGIVWSYIKDMSQYNVLWKEHQKIIFELGNLVNDIYTGSFNVTVMAYFSHEENVKTADIVLPISAQKSARNSSSAFNVPSQEAKVSYKLNPQVSRAIVSVSACGQSTEEFWWSNVFSSDTDTFDNGLDELYGYSPFREIQLYIDGTLAGVVWPFPIIFTGGVSPGFWRPIVGTDAFDLRAPEIDITPFLPLLTDGFYHSFEFKVVGLDVSDNGTATISSIIGPYWVVSGNIFLYLSDNSVAQPPIYATPSQEPEIIAPAPTFTITRELEQNSTGGNVSLEYLVVAERDITIKSSGFLWKQSLSFSNTGLFNQQGRIQKTLQHTSGSALSGYFGDENSINELSFEYPLFVNTAYRDINGGLAIDAWMRRGLEINSSGMPGISTYTLTSGPLHLHTAQWGKPSYRSAADNRNSTSFGDTSDIFESDAGGVVYQRFVHAINGSIVSDKGNRIED